MKMVVVIKTEIHVETHRNSNLFGTAAGLLLCAGIFGNYYFADLALLMRLPILLATLGAAGFLFIKTNSGHKFWIYWQEALVELRKVVWPTKKETIHSTIGVLAMVFIMGIFLWSVDAILVRIVSWLLKHGGV